MSRQKLTLEDVKRAARDYYAKGMLIMQNNSYVSINVYADGISGRRCAIGAALNDVTISKIHDSGTNACGFFAVTPYLDISADDVFEITAIQHMHDRIAGIRRDIDLYKRTGRINPTIWSREQDIAKLEPEFLRMIDWPGEYAKPETYMREVSPVLKRDEMLQFFKDISMVPDGVLEIAE